MGNLETRAALAQAFRFLDALAGEGLGQQMEDGTTLFADKCCEDLERALGADFRAGWPDIAAHMIAPPAMDREAVAKMVEPWADYHGDLPDYDHPLRPVFESGIQYAVELLAKELGVKEWEPCDGTEEFDGDLGGTLTNIVLEAMPKDKDGDPIHPRDLLSTLSADAIRQGEGETLALRAIKAVTATAKDGAAGLSRIMAIASAAGVKQQYSELLQDPYVALIVDRPRTEWAHLFKPGVEGCAIPPEGWQCSRARGHSGPCAATPASHASDGGTSNA